MVHASLDLLSLQGEEAGEDLLYLYVSRLHSREHDKKRDLVFFPFFLSLSLHIEIQNEYFPSTLHSPVKKIPQREN